MLVRTELPEGVWVRTPTKKKYHMAVCFALLEGGGGVLDRRDVLGIMRGRSRMTIDPSHPYNAGTEHI